MNSNACPWNPMFNFMFTMMITTISIYSSIIPPNQLALYLCIHLAYNFISSPWQRAADEDYAVHKLLVICSKLCVKAFQIFTRYICRQNYEQWLILDNVYANLSFNRFDRRIQEYLFIFSDGYWYALKIDANSQMSKTSLTSSRSNQSPGCLRQVCELVGFLFRAE